MSVCGRRQSDRADEAHASMKSWVSNAFWSILSALAFLAAISDVLMNALTSSAASCGRVTAAKESRVADGRRARGGELTLGAQRGTTGNGDLLSLNILFDSTRLSCRSAVVPSPAWTCSVGARRGVTQVRGR